ncbi:alpha/beta hydrolase family protein [Chitinophaga sp. HK235]|uniref:alpha/beta hydrolase n=1 Tax=Chitinophaga sp. HK235 TaxID=2952571 RepID=UPI001BA6CA3A|nr:alpha/beta hydrolase-fold protein [Chitinophaga sp. HK235]
MKHPIITLWLLLVPVLFVKAATVDTVAVFSNAMNKPIRTLVVSPAQKKAGQRFPTVYVLHGYSGNPDRTLKEDIPALPEMADQYGIIFILPDGGFDSWYINSPVRKNSMYETFIGQELVSYIDQHYPTTASRDQRGLMGWSMGGHGALYIGVKQSSNFGVLGSICGAVDFTPFVMDFGIDKLVGADSTKWKYYNVLDNARYFVFSQQQLIISCGAADPFLSYNRRLHEYLDQHHVAHTYIEGEGAHDHAYWSKAAQYQVLFFNFFFKSK